MLSCLKGPACWVKIICLFVDVNYTGGKIAWKGSWVEKEESKKQGKSNFNRSPAVKPTALTERNGSIIWYVGHNADLINKNELNWLIVLMGRSVKQLRCKHEASLSSLQNDEWWRDLWNFHYTCVREAISCETWRRIVQEITQITRLSYLAGHFPGLSIKAVVQQKRSPHSTLSVRVLSHCLQLVQSLSSYKCYEETALGVLQNALLDYNREQNPPKHEGNERECLAHFMTFIPTRSKHPWSDVILLWLRWICWCSVVSGTFSHSSA